MNELQIRSMVQDIIEETLFLTSAMEHTILTTYRTKAKYGSLTVTTDPKYFAQLTKGTDVHPSTLIDLMYDSSTGEPIKFFRIDTEEQITSLDEGSPAVSSTPAPFSNRSSSFSSRSPSFGDRSPSFGDRKSSFSSRSPSFSDSRPSLRSHTPSNRIRTEYHAYVGYCDMGDITLYNSSGRRVKVEQAIPGYNDADLHDDIKDIDETGDRV